MLAPAGPCYRVETERLVLRCWDPADAPAVRRALDESDQHLRPFVPFMRSEPRTLAETATWLRGHRAAFDRDEHYRYAVFDREERTLLGESMLVDRAGDGTWEVGYWQHVAHAGYGYATEAAAALVRVAFGASGLRRLELVCATGNHASAAVARKLGFCHEATLRQSLTDTTDTVHDAMVWTMFADDYPDTPTSATPVRAFDCLGARAL